MILNFLGEARLSVSRFRCVASNTNELYSAVPSPARSFPYVPAPQALFRQHHKWAALYQFAFRYPTRRYSCPRKPPGSGNQRLLMFADCYPAVRAHQDEYKRYEYEMVLRTPGAGVDRQRNRAIGNGWPYFLLIKSRACQANQKKSALKDRSTKDFQYR